MKLKLIEEIATGFDFSISYNTSKFNNDRLLFVFHESDSVIAIIKIISYNFNNKNLSIKEYFTKKCNFKLHILSDFSIFTENTHYIGDYEYQTEFITINPDTLESKIVIPIKGLDYSNLSTLNSFYDMYTSISYNDYFCCPSYIIDLKNNSIVEDLSGKFPDNYIDLIYTKEKEKAYSLKYGSEANILYINKFGEEKYYYPQGYEIFPFVITISDNFIVSAGEPNDEWDGYDAIVDKKVNVAVWNKKSGEIVCTYNGYLAGRFYTNGSCDFIHYFEKYNCLLVKNDYYLSMIYLSKGEIIFSNSSLYSLSVDEKNNKFGFYDDETQSYKIYELIEE